MGQKLRGRDETNARVSLVAVRSRRRVDVRVAGKLLITNYTGISVVAVEEKGGANLANGAYSRGGVSVGSRPACAESPGIFLWPRRFFCGGEAPFLAAEKPEKSPAEVGRGRVLACEAPSQKTGGIRFSRPRFCQFPVLLDPGCQKPLFGQSGLGGGQTGDRHAERRATDVVQTDLVAEHHAGRVAAVLAADADLQVVPRFAALLDARSSSARRRRPDRSSGTDRCGMMSCSLVVVDEAAVVVAAHAQRGLRQVVGAEAEELGGSWRSGRRRWRPGALRSSCRPGIRLASPSRRRPSRPSRGRSFPGS